jgi:Carbohydrate esterase, sialic acid-specific acetylesterase
MKQLPTLIACVVLCCSHLLAEEKKPLKVFVLAGQSNMEGHARIETFDYIGDDPATAPLLKQMRGADGKPTVCDHVWISYLTGRYDGSANGEGIGKLTAGFGARGDNPTQDGGKIGPEFTFGLTMDAALKEPVLIIKTAWGGRSLNTEFRPPSAGPYQLNDYQKKLYYGPPGHGIPKDIDQWLADKKQETGRFYRYMIEHVQSVLADPKRVCPAYDPAAGYEIAGFVWLQGFNDLVDGHTYPAHGKPGRYDLYSELLSHFIRDVRRDLKAPKMPFVIGVLGIDGMKAQADTLEFRKAMAAPASLPEFQGNVFAVQTAPFWSEELGAIDKKYAEVRQMRHFLDSKHKDYANAAGLMSDEQKRDYMKKFEAEHISPAEVVLWKRGASNAGYHYLGCAKTFALMGRAFAEPLIQLPKVGEAKESDTRLHADDKGWRLDKAKIADPARPRVLLIGDSILNGYLKSVTKQLDGQVYIDAWVNPYNQSEHLNKLLAEVLAEGPYDLVHFNMGLHGWQKGRIKDGTFEPLTQAYVEVIRAKLPQAKIIWASSTPVTVKGNPTELDAEINPIIVEHNRLAAKVMQEMKVPVNDFNALLATKLELARGDQFHWKPEAYELLANTVVESVSRELLLKGK